MNEANERGALANTPGTVNIAVVRGAIRGDATPRELPGGGTVVQFDVSIRSGSDGPHPATSVPIAWMNPTVGQLAMLVSGAEVTVVGTVRRRFFRVAGATQSRTEIVVDEVVPSRQRKRLSAALRRAADRILDVA